MMKIKKLLQVKKSKERLQLNAMWDTVLNLYQKKFFFSGDYGVGCGGLLKKAFIRSTDEIKVLDNSIMSVFMS